MKDMIAADTSSLVAFFRAEDAEDVRLITAAISNEQLVLPPPVLSELLSAPNLPVSIANSILSLPQLETTDRFWRRAGELRATVLKQNKKARLADALIAQLCIDHSVPLITRDRDFRHFADLCGLSVMPG